MLYIAYMARKLGITFIILSVLLIGQSHFEHFEAEHDNDSGACELCIASFLLSSGFTPQDNFEIIELKTTFLFETKDNSLNLFYTNPSKTLHLGRAPPLAS